MRIRIGQVSFSSTSTAEEADGENNSKEKPGKASEGGTEYTSETEMQKVEVKFKRNNELGLPGVCDWTFRCSRSRD